MERVMSRRRVGVNFCEGRTEIRLWAPEASSVALKNLTSNKLIELHKGEFGFWDATTEAISPGDRYKFLTNGLNELPDPASLSQPEGVHGPSMALDLNRFQWNDRAWCNIPLQQYILYELHTGTFTPEGNFGGVEKKLDYLVQLGITAIEIMPIAQFAGVRNWGYDGVYPFAVQNSYGGAQGFQKLIDLAHEKKLAVVLDVVYNHLGPEGNYLGGFGPLFTDKYKTPWGSAVNFDDAWCDGIREFFIENALMWFRDFHLDALRLDAVHAIRDFSPVHFLRELKEKADELSRQTGKPYYLIAECDLNDTKYIDPLEQGGYGMDSQWLDEFHHALRVTATAERMGYYSDFKGVEHLAKAYRDAYVYDGQFSEHRKKFFGHRTDNPGHQFVVFSQNHDQVGNRMLGERSSQLSSFEMQKLMAGAVLVSPYLPLLFMGEEWGETAPFLYFVSHTDPALANAVRQGRKAEFAAFHDQGEAPDPMDEETFLKSKLQWSLTDKANHRLLLEYYSELIALRKTCSPLHHLDRSGLDLNFDEQKKTLLLNRSHGDSQVVCFMNFSASVQAQAVSLKFQNWHKLFDSAATKWDGPGDADQRLTSSSISLSPESILIYSNHE